MLNYLEIDVLVRYFRFWAILGTVKDCMQFCVQGSAWRILFLFNHKTSRDENHAEYWFNLTFFCYFTYEHSSSMPVIHICWQYAVAEVKKDSTSENSHEIDFDLPR